MARLYANENFPLPVVEALRRLGHDVLTIQEPDERERPYLIPRSLSLLPRTIERC